MLAFIDESGDPGMRLDRGSSPFFSVAVVVFESFDDARGCQDTILDLRRKLGIRDSAEFHFHRDSHERRLAFLSAVGAERFRVWSFTLNKASPRLAAPGYAYKESLYKSVCKMALENASPHLMDARVVIDGSGERTFQRELATYLRRSVPGVSSVTTRRSNSDHLLQLAAYAVGVANRLVTDRRGAETYFSLLKGRFAQRRLWPSQ